MQLNLLKQLKKNENIKEIEQMINEIKFFDITNREGHAAKLYWHSLFGKEFKREEESQLNLSLNYGYSLLRSYFARSIVKKGLDPRISIFHKSFSNHFALANDLMEPFRPLVDKCVYDSFFTGTSNDKINSITEIKEKLINLFNTKIKINDNSFYLTNAIDMYVDSIVNMTKQPEMSLYDIE